MNIGMKDALTLVKALADAIAGNSDEPLTTYNATTFAFCSISTRT